VFLSVEDIFSKIFNMSFFGVITIDIKFFSAVGLLSTSANSLKSFSRRSRTS
jgi:hypothetical protein